MVKCCSCWSVTFIVQALALMVIVEKWLLSVQKIAKKIFCPKTSQKIEKIFASIVFWSGRINCHVGFIKTLVFVVVVVVMVGVEDNRSKNLTHYKIFISVQEVIQQEPCEQWAHFRQTYFAEESSFSFSTYSLKLKNAYGSFHIEHRLFVLEVFKYVSHEQFQ